MRTIKTKKLHETVCEDKQKQQVIESMFQLLLKNACLDFISGNEKGIIDLCEKELNNKEDTVWKNIPLLIKKIFPTISIRILKYRDKNTVSIKINDTNENLNTYYINARNSGLFREKGALLNSLYNIQEDIENNEEKQKQNTMMNPLLRLAILSGKVEAVSCLLNNDDSINSLDRNGLSPLMLAAEHGYAEICILLIEYGANINITNNNNQTALDIAIKNKNNDIIDIILKSSQYISKQTEIDRYCISIEKNEISENKNKANETYENLRLENGKEIKYNESSKYFSKSLDSKKNYHDFKSLDYDLENEFSKLDWEPEKPFIIKQKNHHEYLDVSDNIFNNHVPVDDEEEWDDVDIDLPQPRNLEKIPFYLDDNDIVLDRICIEKEPKKLYVEDEFKSIIKMIICHARKFKIIRMCDLKNIFFDIEDSEYFVKVLCNILLYHNIVIDHYSKYYFIDPLLENSFSNEEFEENSEDEEIFEEFSREVKIKINYEDKVFVPMSLKFENAEVIRLLTSDKNDMPYE
ncbi:MAG: ankyrin repeat domain-containing protein [Lachnospiraceae bacterium]|nr:ankyrin repeat domain-containing protein [Lachnospiraceae bacterium]